MRKILVGLLFVVGGFGQAPPAPNVIRLAEQPLPAVGQIGAIYTGIVGNQLYCYWVVARFGVGNANISNPSCLNVNPNGGGNVVLSWGGVGGATGYDVIRTLSTFMNNPCTNCLVAGNTGNNFATDTFAQNLAGYQAVAYGLSDATFSINNSTVNPAAVNLNFKGTTTNILSPSGGGATIPATTSTLKGDGAGNAAAVTGTGTNCVLVNGSSTSCSSGGATIPSTTDVIIGDGAGNGADSGHANTTGAFVGTTDTQVLTNKSIAGSEINSGTVGNTYGGTGQNSSASTGLAKVTSGTWSFVSSAHAIGYVFGNSSGVALNAPITVYIPSIPFACTISKWTVIASPSDTATVDILKIATGSSLPSSSITGSGIPTITSATVAGPTTPSGWGSTAVAANDIMAIQLKTVGGTATQVGIILECDE